MIYSNLGSSDLNISRISFGCMSLPADEKESIPIIQTAVDLGINFFDTANIYNDGINETIIGKAVKGMRDRIIIATKAGNHRRPDGGLDWNPSKKYILNCFDESLRRLQTDYIDLFQLHGGTIEDNIEETIGAFEILMLQGKIRYYGISSIRPNVIREYIKRSTIVSVMTQYSLLDRRPEEETLSLIYKHKIGVLARGGVAQGLLIDKPAKSYLDYPVDKVAEAASAVKKISGEQRTPTQTALKYVLQNKAITSAVVGMRTIHQLKEAIETINAPDLSDYELNLLKNSITPSKYTIHR